MSFICAEVNVDGVLWIAEPIWDESEKKRVIGKSSKYHFY